VTVDFFDYDPRMASYEAERRRKAAGIPDSVTGRRRSAAQITRDVLFSEDAWQISHPRKW